MNGSPPKDMSISKSQKVFGKTPLEIYLTSWDKIILDYLDGSKYKCLIRKREDREKDHVKMEVEIEVM